MNEAGASDAPTDAGQRQRAGRTALLAWAIVAALVAGLVHLNITLPAIGHLGSALVALLFLYVPMWVGRSRREDLIDYGLVAEPVGRGLVIATVAFFVIFPLFVVGYVAFYEVACGTDLLAQLVPPGMCRRYVGIDAFHLPDWSWSLFETEQARTNTLSLGWCAVQLVVVALPEELFFRGFLLRLLEQRWPPRRRVLGGGIGLALVVSSLAFALIHLPKDGDPRALATFFPGLLFGWMRSATGSILAPTLTHAGSNILVRFLDLSAMR